MNTGFAEATIKHVSMHPKDWEVRFTDIGLIQPGDRNHLDRRLYVGSCVQGLCKQSKITTLLVEEPPQTMYNKNDSVKMIIARAQSVFRVVGMANFILGMIYPSGIDIRTILPVQWEAGMKSRAERIFQDTKEMQVKDISLRMANHTLSHKTQEMFQWAHRAKPPKSRVNFPLETQAESNTADAVNMLHQYVLAWQTTLIPKHVY